MLAVRRHEHVHDPSRFAKGMASAELSQHVIELGGRSNGEKALDLSFGMVLLLTYFATAGAKSWSPDGDFSK
jgi:hypothetical protein